MATISVTMVSHNEENLIEECLKSFQWADEIIVVDASSNDKTVEIAKAYTNKVFIRENYLNFYYNVKFAIEQTSCDWIFLTAPDERCTPELADEIRKKIAHQREVNGFYLPRKNYFLGKWLKYGGNYPDWQLRLFQKGKGYYKCESVHEQLSLEGEVGYLKNPLIHYSYSSLNELLKKIDLYARADFKYLKEKNWKIKPSNYFWFFILRPFLVFCRKYFLKFGFLDGIEGLIFAVSSAYADFYRSAYYLNICRKGN